MEHCFRSIHVNVNVVVGLYIHFTFTVTHTLYVLCNCTFSAGSTPMVSSGRFMLCALQWWCFQWKRNEPKHHWDFAKCQSISEYLLPEEDALRRAESASPRKPSAHVPLCCTTAWRYHVHTSASLAVCLFVFTFVCASEFCLEYYHFPCEVHYLWSDALSSLHT